MIYGWCHDELVALPPQGELRHEMEADAEPKLYVHTVTFARGVVKASIPLETFLTLFPRSASGR